MRAVAMLAGVIGVAAAGAAAAEPGVTIRNAIARVTVIQEVRSDVAVQVVHANSRLPLKIDRFGDQVIVDGGLAMRSPNCLAWMGARGARAWGVGRVNWEDMPQIVVHAPRRASVAVSGAVYGSAGPGESLDLSNSGCGDWMIADQSGALRVRLAGSGDVRAASAGSLEAAITGSSDLTLAVVHNGMDAAIVGSGDINAIGVDGPLRARISGSGDVHVREGNVTDMQVAVSGSGDVRFGGTARTLVAKVSGSGDVSVTRVIGPVERHVSGSGDVRVGR